MKSLGDPDVRTATAERIKTVQPTSQAAWGRMSAHQMICHCADSFRLTVGEKDAASMSGLFQRTIMKWFALYVPASWPKGLPTMPEMRQGDGGTPPGEFSRDRRDLLVLMERFCQPDRTFDGVEHPLFGRLSPAQWRRWAYLHLNHHLRQFGA